MRVERLFARPAHRAQRLLRELALGCLISLGGLPVHAALIMSITPATQTVDGGNTVTAYVTMSSVDDLDSAQFSLHWDPGVLIYSSATLTGLPTPTGTIFSLNQADVSSGNLGFSYGAIVPVDLASATAILTLQFSTTGAGGSTSLNFTDTPTSREVINAFNDPVTWQNGSITVTAVPEPAHIALGVFGMVLAGARGVRWGLRRRQATRS